MCVCVCVCVCVCAPCCARRVRRECVWGARDARGALPFPCCPHPHMKVESGRAQEAVPLLVCEDDELGKWFRTGEVITGLRRVGVELLVLVDEGWRLQGRRRFPVAGCRSEVVRAWLSDCRAVAKVGPQASGCCCNRQGGPRGGIRGAEDKGVHGTCGTLHPVHHFVEVFRNNDPPTGHISMELGRRASLGSSCLLC